MQDFPITTLTNGLRVGNFSSAHAFTFTDGSVLAGCQAETCKACELEAYEREVMFYAHNHIQEEIGLISLDFDLTDAVYQRAKAWINLIDEGKVDLVITPLPVMQAMKKVALTDNFRQHFPTIRMADRVSKQACIDKFCI